MASKTRMGRSGKSVSLTVEEENDLGLTLEERKVLRDMERRLADVTFVPKLDQQLKLDRQLLSETSTAWTDSNQYSADTKQNREKKVKNPETSKMKNKSSEKAKKSKRSKKEENKLSLSGSNGRNMNQCHLVAKDDEEIRVKDIKLRDLIHSNSVLFSIRNILSDFLQNNDTNFLQNVSPQLREVIFTHHKSEEKESQVGEKKAETKSKSEDRFRKILEQELAQLLEVCYADCSSPLALKSNSKNYKQNKKAIEGGKKTQRQRERENKKLQRRRTTKAKSKANKKSKTRSIQLNTDPIEVFAVQSSSSNLGLRTPSGKMIRGRKFSTRSPDSTISSLSLSTFSSEQDINLGEADEKLLLLGWKWSADTDTDINLREKIRRSRSLSSSTRKWRLTDNTWVGLKASLGNEQSERNDERRGRRRSRKSVRKRKVEKKQAFVDRLSTPKYPVTRAKPKSSEKRLRKHSAQR